MRLAQLLFKPKWQDKDAAVRRTAVSASTDTDLIEALPRLVREDADAGVRLAALKRLNDYENWRERSTGDVDETVRCSARSMYLTMLCASIDAPSMKRRIAELDTLNSAEIEKVATTAVQRDLRAAALERSTRPGLLAERAIADPDAALRLAALERIDDANLLERIAERARKTDKAVSRRARELLESSRISSGDGIAIAYRARLLCERAELLLRSPHAGMDRELGEIDSAWVALGPAIPVRIVARYRGTHALALRALDLLQNPQLANAAEPIPHNVSSAVQPEPLQELPPTVVPEVLVSQARFDAALVAAQTQARAEGERRKVLQEELKQLLPLFGAAIDCGDSAAAHRIHASIRAGMTSLYEVPADLKRNLTPLEARHDEMKRWLHWSNNQRRRVLIAEIEALSGSGLHPDALATRVREARQEWQRLDAAEGIAVDSETAPGISRRFHAVCHRVLRPTKGYFSKRDEIRKSHGSEMEALLERVAAIGDDTIDWNELAALRNETIAALRSLDEVDPRTRTARAKRLKDAIARTSTLILSHESQIEASKQRLIEQATALTNGGNEATLPREVRELQKRWTALGGGRRSVDQRQWREFRAACDTVFGKLDAAREHRDAQVAATFAQTQDIVTELEALALDETASVESVRAYLRELDARWQTVGTDDRVLVQRQRQAHDAIAMRLKDAARRERLRRYTLAMQKYTLVRAIETGVPVSPERWDALASTTPAFDTALQARTLQVPVGHGGESETARKILVQLEFLAGIDSPAEDRQLRMNHQVQRLSSRMRSGNTTAPDRELDDLLVAWFAQTPQTPELEDRFARAATALIDALP